MTRCTPLWTCRGIRCWTATCAFLGRVWLGLGLAAFWMVPRLHAHTVLFRVVWGAIFIGGLGRLLSMLVVGWPPAPFIAFTVLEIVGAPLFVAWHARVVNPLPC